MNQSMPHLRAECSATRIAIYRLGQTEPLLVQHAAPDARPFIHPILAPDGNGTLTENAPPHHAWQHGLYVGLNDVNGVGFWTEGLSGNPNDGTFHPQPLMAAVIDGASCRWLVTCSWRDPSGRQLLVESQAWTLYDRGTSYDLDVVWTLRASEALTFGHSSYGGLFIRMPFITNATVVTSTGLGTPAEADGQRAQWVAIAMPILDRRGSDARCGMALMDHPKNPEHPVPWRVDGQYGIAPSRCIAGAWQLAAGASTTARHRAFIHNGSSNLAAIAASWASFIH